MVMIAAAVAGLLGGVLLTLLWQYFNKKGRKAREARDWAWLLREHGPFTEEKCGELWRTREGLLGIRLTGQTIVLQPTDVITDPTANGLWVQRDGQGELKPVAFFEWEEGYAPNPFIEESVKVLTVA